MSNFQSFPKVIRSSRFWRAIAIIAALTAASSLRIQATSPAERSFRDLAETRNYTAGRPVGITPSRDGKSILFLRSGSRDTVQNLYEFNIANQRETKLVDVATLHLDGVPLDEEEERYRERARISTSGLSTFQLSADNRTILFSFASRLFVFDRQTGQLKQLPGTGWFRGKLSPDGDYVAAVMKRELFVISISTGKFEAVTHGASETLSHGLAEFVAAEEMDRREGFWWSPDSKDLLFQETDESSVEVRFISDPESPARPPKKYFYPRAGTSNARVRLGLISRSGGKVRWIKWDTETYPYLVRVAWQDIRFPLSILVKSRDQQEQQLLAVDTVSRVTRVLLQEKDPAWLESDNQSLMPVWLSPRQFLWTTERNGQWQLELRDSTGQIHNEITPTDFIYRGLLHFDEKARFVFVRGSHNASDIGVWRFALGGGDEGIAIYDTPGVHEAAFFHGSIFAHSFSALSGEQTIEIPAASGDLTSQLNSVSENLPATPRVQLLHTASSPAFNAAIIRPLDFRSGQKYPVILDVYAGPTTIRVTSVARDYLLDQWMADQGYVVIRIDGRGTPWHGRDWQRTIRGNLIDTALGDQVTGLKAIGQAYPELDMTRVGVTGWSFGGYFSAMATMRRPDVFRCGAAGALVSSWEDYDSCYSERYLGSPKDHPEAYRVSDVLTYAPDLTRPLLLRHGLYDDNVYFMHTQQLAHALSQAGKPFDLLPLKATHMLSDLEVQWQDQKRVMEFFSEHLSPEK